MSLVKKKPAAEKAAKKPAAKKSAASKGSTLSNAKLYDVIQRPLITEKAHGLVELNKVVFKISPTATKKDVKAAVESIFNVSVTKVNTINVEGKTKRFRGQEGQRSDFRKAIVTLAEGQSIDFTAGAR